MFAPWGGLPGRYPKTRQESCFPFFPGGHIGYYRCNLLNFYSYLLPRVLFTIISLQKQSQESDISTINAKPFKYKDFKGDMPYRKVSELLLSDN